MAVVSDELWSSIAPRRSARPMLVIAAVLAVLMAAAWWSGAVVPRLSLTPSLVERGEAVGRVRLHADLRNDGLFPVEPSSSAWGTTLRVHSLSPPATGRGARWQLAGGGGRPVVLELSVPCDGSATWDLEMVAYGQLSGYNVRLGWNDDRLPGWRREVLEIACR